MISVAGLAKLANVVEEKDNVVEEKEGDIREECDEDVEKIEEEDGIGMEEERGKDERRLARDGNMEVARAREKVGNLYTAVVIKDEIEVEDSIIRLSDLDEQLEDSNGKECVQDDESEKLLKNKQCNTFQRPNQASALESRKEKEPECSLKNAALDKKREKVSENSPEKNEQKVSEIRLKNAAAGKNKQEESERSLKSALEKQWSNSGKERWDEKVIESRNLEDNDLQSLIKYLVTKKRPDKETIKKIVSLTRTKLSKLEEMEVDTGEEEKRKKNIKSKSQAEPRKVISTVEATRVTSKVELNGVTSKVEPSGRVISKKSASELKDEIIQTMKRNAEERENEVRRAAKVLRRMDVEEEKEEDERDDIEKEWTGMRREEMGVREASREDEKKRRVEHLLKNGKVNVSR